MNWIIHYDSMCWLASSILHSSQFFDIECIKFWQVSHLYLNGLVIRSKRWCMQSLKCMKTSKLLFFHILNYLRFMQIRIYVYSLICFRHNGQVFLLWIFMMPHQKTPKIIWNFFPIFFFWCMKKIIHVKKHSLKILIRNSKLLKLFLYPYIHF